MKTFTPNPTLTAAWELFADYYHNAEIARRRFSGLRQWILILGVTATILALVHQLYLKGASIPLPLIPGITLDQISRVIVILLPITVSALLAGSHKFNRGLSWVLLRGGSESIKHEIYKYRTKTLTYNLDNTENESRDEILARQLNNIAERIMKTEVNQSSLKIFEGSIPPQFGLESGDDGFGDLNSEGYVQFRLKSKMNFYNQKILELDKKVRWLQWAVIGFGGLGTLLAAVGFEVWIAVTTAIVGAVTSFLEFNQMESSLSSYNQTLTDLESVLIWWNAVPQLNKFSPDTFEKLVDNAEAVIQAEVSGWIRNLKDALQDLYQQDYETVDTPHPSTLAFLEGIGGGPTPFDPLDGQLPVDLTPEDLEALDEIPGFGLPPMELSDDDITVLTDIGFDDPNPALDPESVLTGDLGLSAYDIGLDDFIPRELTEEELSSAGLRMLEDSSEVKSEPEE